MVDLRKEPLAGIARSPLGSPPVDIVRAIVADVAERGDAALLAYTQRFDHVTLDSSRLKVGDDEIDQAASKVASDFVDACAVAVKRIEATCRRQLLIPWTEEHAGARIGEVVHPLERAGIYAPGGKAAYPSTVIMCATPAATAGVRHIMLCVPPAVDGSIDAHTLVAARIAGVTDVYRAGGAQAIAAMAYGTETIPKAEVVVGPGNAYVTAAKMQVAGVVRVDAPAGPSEIAIVADEYASPRFVAADLIAQAEHGPLGAYVLISWSEQLIQDTCVQLAHQWESIGSPGDIREVLAKGGCAALVADVKQAIYVANKFAPEHVELHVEDPAGCVDGIRNAGAIFVGPWSPVPIGDYLAGVNHVLPTGAAASWSSGLRAAHFQKTSYTVEYTRDALKADADKLRAMALAEGLPNHARSVDLRFEDSIYE